MSRYSQPSPDLVAANRPDPESDASGLPRKASRHDRTTAAEFLPLWFERGLVVVTSGVLSFGGFGLLLAFFGDYRIAPVLLVGAATTVAASVIAWPYRRRATRAGRAARPVVLPAIGVCVVALGSGAWNAHLAGHHALIGRDPGVYADTAKWIAVHGTLEVRTGPDWSSKGPDMVVASPGMYVEGGDRLEFQFDHMTPVLLAEADNLGGDRLMFRLPALLGALGLCAVYAVGCRLVRRPWLVLAAVTALAVSLPQINVSRDTLSEPSVQLLVWAGMWLLLAAYERRRLGLAMLAGAALAGTMLSRIDAPVYLIPLPAVGALVWLSASPGRDRRFLARMYATIACAAVPVATLATFDVRNRGGHYYADLHTQVRQLTLGLAASLGVGALLIALWPLVAPRVRPATRRILAHRSGAGWFFGSLVAIILAGAWLVRPAIMHPRHVSTPGVYGFIGALQAVAGYAYDPSRTYGEKTMVWISWYLGPITVGLAIVGAAILVARLCQRHDPAAAVVLTVAGAGTVLYLWNPSISPDQIWAMRRFVPVGLPLFVLLAALALAQLADLVFTTRSASIGTRLAVGAGVAGMIALPLKTTFPVRDFQPQRSYVALVDATCRVTGPQAAILLAPGHQLDQEMAPGLRSWCDVPVAVLTGKLTAAQLQQVAAAWQAEGRNLWVLGFTPSFIAASAPGLHPVLVGATSDTRELEVRLDRAPRQYVVAQPFSIYAAPVVP